MIPMPAVRLTFALLAVVALTERAAMADVGSERRPKSFITAGPTFDLGLLDLAPHFGGEMAVAQYAGRWGFGSAFGFTSGRLYLEAQPAVVLGGRPHSLVLGFNPGFVVDVTSDSPRYGGQLTLWGNYAHDGERLRASPLFPFVRVQAVVGVGIVVTGGVMLKLALPVT
jgi:hypothetical protein